MGVWGQSPQEKGGAEDRRKPGCSGGEGFPPFLFIDIFLLVYSEAWKNSGSGGVAAGIGTHILEHLADLSAGGMDEEESFARVVDSLGNLDELIETLSGRKVKIPIWRHELTVYGLGLFYGMVYLCAMILGFNHWGLWRVSLYIGVGGFLAYFVPFFNNSYGGRFGINCLRRRRPIITPPQGEPWG
jgi:hypothetical protein